jgi:hypothetical protein
MLPSTAASASVADNERRNATPTPRPIHCHVVTAGSIGNGAAVLNPHRSIAGRVVTVEDAHPIHSGPQALGPPVVPLDENLQLVRVEHGSAQANAVPRLAELDAVALLGNLIGYGQVIGISAATT